ncbi:chemotaxis protein CheD [Muricoccus radiodurans]|uniref:chemotaxis protein CheD n=1 Tax=Muricoccus radiodurans TaxID=2231721 RepID=UPI003CEAF524
MTAAGTAGIEGPLPAPGVDRRVNIVQGEFRVTADPEVVLTTILGSCVAACLRDPVAGVGGMNHFLLPGEIGGGGESMRYGVHAMELLVNGLLRRGARRERLEAKLFGGARMLDGLTDVGAQNAAFAERFLREERIAHSGGSLRGERGRRIQFWPVTGRARQLVIEGHEAKVFAEERRVKAPPPVEAGNVELF